MSCLKVCINSYVKDDDEGEGLKRMLFMYEGLESVVERLGISAEDSKRGLADDPIDLVTDSGESDEDLNVGGKDPVDPAAVEVEVGVDVDAGADSTSETASEQEPEEEEKRPAASQSEEVVETIVI